MDLQNTTTPIAEARYHLKYCINASGIFSASPLGNQIEGSRKKESFAIRRRKIYKTIAPSNPEPMLGKEWIRGKLSNPEAPSVPE
jgi:hypothetical protein